MSSWGKVEEADILYGSWEINDQGDGGKSERIYNLLYLAMPLIKTSPLQMTRSNAGIILPGETIKQKYSSCPAQLSEGLTL